MEKIKVDIMGKAPSLKEIEDYNKYNLEDVAYLKVVTFCFFGALHFLVLSTLWFLLPHSLLVVIIYIFILFSSAHFIFVSLREFEGVGVFMRVENFISPELSECLTELINNHPELKSYHNQVIGQGREFLKSEYEACVRFAERRCV